MKILFFVQNLLAGGMERRLLELIRYLKLNDGYDIVLVIAEDDIYFDYVTKLGVRIELIKRKSKYDPTLFVRFYRLCKQFNPDIIHAWGRFATFNAIPAKILCRKPLLSNLINNAKVDFRKHSLDKIQHKSGLFFADIILSNSEAGLRAYKINSPKARVIRNGVYIERFNNESDKLSERLKLKVYTDYIVVMVARFTKSKDYDLFIDVARETGRNRNDTTFIGVGDGPERSRIQNRIKDEHLNNVLLVGNRDDIETIIAASDIGLLCTYSEGISNSVIEFMALAKPVIVTDLYGGSREVIMEGETGFCTSRDVNTIIQQLNLLLDDDNLRKTMGNKGKERILGEFTIEKMGNNFIEVI